MDTWLKSRFPDWPQSIYVFQVWPKLHTYFFTNVGVRIYVHLKTQHMLSALQSVTERTPHTQFLNVRAISIGHLNFFPPKT